MNGYKQVHHISKMSPLYPGEMQKSCILELVRDRPTCDYSCTSSVKKSKEAQFLNSHFVTLQLKFQINNILQELFIFCSGIYASIYFFATTVSHNIHMSQLILKSAYYNIDQLFTRIRVGLTEKKMAVKIVKKTIQNSTT